MTSVFIGVVSHVGSRFEVSQGADGLAAKLQGSLADTSVEAEVAVRTDDAHDPATLPIDGRMAWECISEQLRLEQRWQRYLRGQEAARPSIRDQAVIVFRTMQMAFRLWRPWHGTSAVDAAEIRLVRRLVNIELSHLALMREAVAAGHPWTLILEDDAGASDVEDCAAGLASLMRAGDAQARPAYVNVSASFSNAELGIDGLLRAVPDVAWAGSRRRVVTQSSRPVTNTVCAVLYRTSFLAELIQVMDRLPLTPVVPIDWKLNVALMEMFQTGELGSGDCWLVEPAPIDQLSMR